MTPSTSQGSSETTREAFCFDLYRRYKPETLPECSPEILEFFVGFAEGDGTFQTWYSNGRPRACFRIEQEHPQALTFLKNKLGFGRVRPVVRRVTRAGVPVIQKNWIYEVGKQDQLFLLACLFHGNLVLDHTHLRYEKWLTFLSLPPDFVLSEADDARGERNKKSGTFLIGLDNAWLAGFWQADGGFSAWGAPQAAGFHIILKAYITQHGEARALHRIGRLLENAHKNLESSRNQETGKVYQRLSIASTQGLRRVLHYFETYPLRGTKRLSFLRWARVWGARERLREGTFVETEKAFEKLRRLIRATKTKDRTTK